MAGKLNNTNITVVVVFLVAGSISGLLFAWLVTAPSLADFVFIKGDKFLIPRNEYWIAYGMFFLSGLILGYIVSRSFGYLREAACPASRYLVASILIVTSTVGGEVIASWFVDTLTISVVSHLISILIAIFMLSLALRLLTLRWNIYLPLAMLVVLFVSLVTTVSIYKVFKLSNVLYDFIYFVLRNSLLSAVIGYWLSSTNFRSEQSLD